MLGRKKRSVPKKFIVISICTIILIFLVIFSFTLKEGELKDELKRIAREYHSPYTRVIKDERIKPLISII